MSHELNLLTSYAPSHDPGILKLQTLKCHTSDVGKIWLCVRRRIVISDTDRVNVCLPNRRNPYYADIW